MTMSGIGTDEHKTAFKNLEPQITEIPCLVPYNSYIINYPNVLTKGKQERTGRYTWQERPGGNLSLKTVAQEINAPIGSFRSIVRGKCGAKEFFKL